MVEIYVEGLVGTPSSDFSSHGAASASGAPAEARCDPENPLVSSSGSTLASVAGSRLTRHSSTPRLQASTAGGVGAGVESLGLGGVRDGKSIRGNSMGDRVIWPDGSKFEWTRSSWRGRGISISSVLKRR